MAQRRYRQDPKTGQMRGAVGGPGATPPAPAPMLRGAQPAVRTPADEGDTSPSAWNTYQERLDKQIAHVVDGAAKQMNVPPGRLRQDFDWWYNNPDKFEHCASPDPDLAHTPESCGLPDTPRMRAALRKLGYEQHLAKPLPVFVYGTLRQGQGNSGLMDPAVKDVEPATVHGVAIYGNHFSFPYACEHDDPDAVTVGELVTLDGGDEGIMARGRLDWLEGFDSDAPSGSHYERRATTVSVTGADGAVREEECWIYLARGSARRDLRESDRIPHGDWVAASMERRTDLPWRR